MNREENGGRLVEKPSQTVWDRIQEAFDSKNVPKIAEKLDLRKQAVYKWRNGKLPGLENFIAISESTGCSLHWLVIGEGPKRIGKADAHTDLNYKQNDKLTDDDRKLVSSLIAALERGLKE